GRSRSTSRPPPRRSCRGAWPALPVSSTSCGTARRSSTRGRRPTTIRLRRRGTCSSPRTRPPPGPAARSRRSRPRRWYTSVGCAKGEYRAPATGTCSTISGSPSLRPRAWRPSPTATTSLGTPGPMTTPRSRPRRQVPRSARAPERQRVRVIDGNLTLGDGPPEPCAATPAGWMPKSCVFGIPNGAHVDTSGVVTLPDSTQYRIPKCPELHHAPYTMTVTRAYDYAGDSSKTVLETSSGTYAWSDGAGGQPQLVALLYADLLGPVTLSPGAVEMTVGGAHLGRGAASTPSDPVYRFLRASP